MMDFTIQMVMRMFWYEPRLSIPEFPSTEQRNLNLGFVQKLWTPDVYMMNLRKSVSPQLYSPAISLNVFGDKRLRYSKL
ncbi:unnamed protein product [Darwinula stevensoni]|uniref:Neurotransmitter-gated ion-channel ligand-binding domain-containing protein n=1 Tax=Darwinula stevensoni TaxID=69355 RepID=A0A7R8X3Y7_9CRUS|nr:unnamed protein product [Darwinula stevensoni]CAG0879109.1 unnamed protein product [Darwinula stevensoni]